MKHNWKWLALALTLALMLVSMAASAEFEVDLPTLPQTAEVEATPLTLGQTAQAVIPEGGGYAYFSFTPEETDTYIFYSTSNDDTYGCLYDADMNEITSDDQGGENDNFRIEYPLEAGTVYYFGARYYNESNYGTFDVTLSIENNLTAYGDFYSRSIPLGQTTTMTTVASCNTGSIHYQWYTAERSGEIWGENVAVEGATESVFTPDTITTYTRYDCVVTDDFGNWCDVYFYVSIDNGFNVWHVGNNEIYVEPGSCATLQVNASCNNGGLHYQWFDNSSGIIEGATDATYITEALSEYHSYYCRVYDDYGNYATPWLYVRMDTGLTIEAVGDTHVLVPAGQSVTLEVTTSCNYGEYHNQWYSVNAYGSGSSIDGATGLSYTIDAVNSYQHLSCIVFDTFDNSRSVDFYVGVDNQFYLDDAGDHYFNVDPGETRELSVSAGCADDSLTYRWSRYAYESETQGWYTRVLEDETGPSLTTQPIYGHTTYYCHVEDGYGNYGDISYDFSVQNAIRVEKGSYDIYVDPGESVTLTATATSATELHYEWYNDTNGNAVGEYTNTYTVDTVTQYASYHCHIRDDYGNYTNIWFYVHVENHLTARAAGDNYINVTLGDTATLVVNASCTQGELSYRWRKYWTDANGIRHDVYIDGASSNVYTTEPIERYAQYYCEVTDQYGNQTRVDFYVGIDNHLEASCVGDSSRTVVVGDTATLEVNASCAEGDLTYYWSKSWYDDNDNWQWQDRIDGATGSVFTTEPLNRHVNYYCYVTDQYGNQQEVGFYIYIDNHLIAERVGDYEVYVAPGDTVTLEVSADCAQGELSYRWSKEWRDVNGNWRGEDINGATGVIYTTEPVERSVWYYCYVTDQYHNQITVDFSVAIDNQLTISADPNWTGSVAPGERATLGVIATCASGGIHYQWQKLETNNENDYWNWVTIDGATEATYITDPITEHMNYSCRVSDDYGNVNSISFGVGIENHLTANCVGSSDKYVHPDDSVEMAVEADCDTGEIHYQWMKLEGSNEHGSWWGAIDGATNASYTVEAVNARTNYYCRVTDDYGNSRDVWFYIYIRNGFEAREVSKWHQYVMYGESVTLEVEGKCDEGDIHYQWYFEDEDEGSIELDEKGPSLEITDITESAGYYCRVSDDYGSSESIYFTITIDNGFGIDKRENNVYVPYGETATLEASAYCDRGELIYEWYMEVYDEEEDEWNEEQIEDVTGPILVTDVITETIEYRCRVSDEYGNGATIYFNVGVENGFWARRVGDKEQVKHLNETLTLAVEAGCAEGGTLSYKWYAENYDDEEDDWYYGSIEGANGPSYTIPADRRGGWYECIVSDQYGNREFISFDVDFDSGLRISADGDRVRYVNTGDSVTLSVQVTALTDEINYYWYANGKEIEGADTATYTTPELTETTMFECEVSDGYDGWASVDFMCVVQDNMLPLDEDVEINIDYGSRYLAFVPAETDNYTLESFGSLDTYVSLYNADLERIISDDDGGSEGNFRLTCKLEAGEKYFYRVGLYEDEGYSGGSFTVRLTRGGDSGVDDDEVRGTIYLQPGQTVTLPGPYYEEEGQYEFESIEVEFGNAVTTSGDEITAVSAGTAYIRCYIEEDWTRFYRVEVFEGNANAFTLPTALKEIEAGAFADVGNLEIIELADTVNRVGSDAFNGSGLKQIIVNGDKTILGGVSMRGAEDATIVCQEGSRAEKYAQNHDMIYVYPR